MKTGSMIYVCRRWRSIAYRYAYLGTPRHLSKLRAPV